MINLEHLEEQFASGLCLCSSRDGHVGMYALISELRAARECVAVLRQYFDRDGDAMMGCALSEYDRVTKGEP